MASCAIPGWYAPVQIGGRRYIDGGTWSTTNVDLLATESLDEVYVLAPMASFVDDHPAAGSRPGSSAGVRRQVTRRLLSEAAEGHAGPARRSPCSRPDPRTSRPSART